MANMLNRKKRSLLSTILNAYNGNPRKFATISSPKPLQPNIGTIPGCISLSQSIAQDSNLDKGKELHSWMLKHDFMSSPLSITSLIKMYTKCNQLSYAFSVFLESKGLNNVFTYNAIIAAFVGNKLYEKGFKLYLEMKQQSVIPDKFTFPCVIKSCLDVVQVKMIHPAIFKLGLDLDIYIGSALVNCYLKFGAIEEASCELDELLFAMPIKSYPDVWKAFFAASKVQGNPYFAQVAAKQIEELDPEHSGSYALMLSIYEAIATG